MKLYLVRHGEAEPKAVNPDRPLTVRGRADVENVAKAAAGRIGSLDVIWTSPKTRARETADILAAHLKPAHGLVERDDLVAGPVGQVAADVESSAGEVMIVSHIPFLPSLAGKLLANDADTRRVPFPPGGLTCLDTDHALHWTLAWTLSPENV